jgi:glutathione S-transferase
MMPTLIEGYQTILGDPPHLYKYICKTKGVDEKFYPMKDMNRDKKKLIDQYLEYIQWMVKRNSDRLAKFKIEKILLDKQIIEKEETTYSEAEEQKEREIFFTIIVPNLESHLDGGKIFLCGYDFSVADLAYFNELINVIEMTG